MPQHWPGSLFTEIFEGHEIIGDSLSVTVTVKEQVAVWLLAAVTTKVLVVTPTGKQKPLACPAV